MSVDARASRTPISLPNEEWRPAVGYEGRYEISNLGRVYSIKRPGAGRSGRLMALRPLVGGYPSVALWDGAKYRRDAVHRLMMYAFVGPRPAGADGECIRHLDGDATNCVLTNLKYGTHVENAADKKRHPGYVKPSLPPGARRKYTRKPIPHGTNAGYQMHRDRNEAIPAGDPCGCRAAHAAWVREKGAKR